MTICITLDTDWVHEDVVAHSLDLLARHRVRATVFATGDYRCLRHADPELVRVGLHPACTSIPDMEQALTDLLVLYPHARAVRSHCLTHSSRFWPLFHRLGLTTSSNVLLPGHPNLRPTTFLPGVTECPIHFMDDYRLLEGPLDGSEEARKLADDTGWEGLKVLAFHPIHVFLNCESPDRYQRGREHQADPDRLRQLRHHGFGVGSLFEAVLEEIAKRNSSGDTAATPDTADTACGAFLEEAAGRRT